MRRRNGARNALQEANVSIPRRMTKVEEASQEERAERSGPGMKVRARTARRARRFGCWGGDGFAADPTVDMTEPAAGDERAKHNWRAQGTC